MGDISPEIKSFLKNDVQAVWQLELLLVMMDTPEPIDTAELARTLYLPPASVEYALQMFSKQGFISEVHNYSKKYQYEPKSEKKNKLVQDIAKLYSKHRIDFIKIIFSHPSKQFDIN